MAAVLARGFRSALRRMYSLEAQRTDFDAALRQPRRRRLLVSRTRNEAVGHSARADPGGVLWRPADRGAQDPARIRARLGEEVFVDRLGAEAPFFAYTSGRRAWRGRPRRTCVAGRAAAERTSCLPARSTSDVWPRPARWTGGPADRGGPGALPRDVRTVLLYRGRLEDADAQFGELEREGERASRAEWIARGLEYQGRTAWYRGELHVAEELFERGLSRLPPAEFRIEADLHNDLGIVYYYRGRPEDAFAQHTAALELRERIGDRLGMAKSYSNIGNLLADFRDDLEGAERYYRRGLGMPRRSATGRCNTVRCSTGDDHAGSGRVDRGHRDLSQGRAAAGRDRLGHARYLNLQRQAESEIALGKIDRALRPLQECLSRGDFVLEPANRVNTRTFLFDAYLRACEDEFAGAAIADARRLVDELHVEEALETVLLREGRWLAARGSWAEAAVAFGEAADQARRQNHGSFAALADAHRFRARTRAGERDVEMPSGEPRREPPLRAVIGYLNADAAAEREPTPEAAAALEFVADEAARLGDPGLERAAAERLAEVWRSCGDEAAHASALERAAHAMAAIEKELSKDLAEEFAAHPRNAALRQATEALR